MKLKNSKVVILFYLSSLIYILYFFGYQNFNINNPLALSNYFRSIDVIGLEYYYRNIYFSNLNETVWLIVPLSAISHLLNNIDYFMIYLTKLN